MTPAERAWAEINLNVSKWHGTRPARIDERETLLIAAVIVAAICPGSGPIVTFLRRLAVRVG